MNALFITLFDTTKPMKTLSQVVSVILLTVCLFAQAHAGLLINPKRVVLADRDRSATLDLMNEGSEVARYQIFFEQKMMNEAGAIVDVPELDEDAVYAKDMIRYSPRRVDIAPGQKQTIRLAVRRPKDLPAGEYISHLVFKEIPSKVDRAPESQSEERLKLAFRPTLKLAIPIIVRKGELDASGAISEVRLSSKEQGQSLLSFHLQRNGERSLYGDVEIYEMAGDQLGERIGFARGIALYTTVSQRKVNVPLVRPVSEDINSLFVRYDEGGKYGGTNVVELPVTLD